MSGPITEQLAEDAAGRARRRQLLDRLALAITALGEDLTDWTATELAQLHMMGMDLARRTNLALAEHDERRQPPVPPSYVSKLTR